MNVSWTYNLILHSLRGETHINTLRRIDTAIRVDMINRHYDTGFFGFLSDLTGIFCEATVVDLSIAIVRRSILYLDEAK